MEAKAKIVEIKERYVRLAENQELPKECQDCGLYCQFSSGITKLLKVVTLPDGKKITWRKVEL